MGDVGSPSAVNDWTGYYRGYRLRANPDGEVWWQLYNGTERLHVDPSPTEIVDRLLSLKPRGGRFHVTEERDVLTRVESDDGYQAKWLGEMELDGKLRPGEDPEQAIAVRPDDLSPGDLWPSVYDGSRFSFRDRDQVWWDNPETHRRHYVDKPLPDHIYAELRRYKSQGGSIRVTPWGDVITLIPFHPLPDRVENQFGELPSVVRKIIKLRKERGVEMLPIYVGSVEDYRFKITEPENLSDPLSEEEAEELESWAKNLGRTTDRSDDDHQAEEPTQDPDRDPTFNDDPRDWVNEEEEEEE